MPSDLNMANEKDYSLPQNPQNKTQPPASFIYALAFLPPFAIIQCPHSHRRRKQQRTNAWRKDCR